MAGVSCLNSFLTKSLTVSSPQVQLAQSNSISPTSSIRIPSNKPLQSKNFSIPGPSHSRSASHIRASDEPAVIVEPIFEVEETSTKKALIDSVYGTERGLTATYETRAEILENITQLEAENPTPAPTDALTLLDGKWILAYTSFYGLFPLLAKGKFPLVKVEEFSQIIDSEEFTVQNSVLLSVPYATTSLSTNAKFEVRSPKRVQIKFVEGVIGTPQITDSIVLPDEVQIFGHKIDLTPIMGLITSIENTASSVAKNFSSKPSLKIPISYGDGQWLLTTYLDEELRISRGDAGSVFVFIKEGSSLLAP